MKSTRPQVLAAGAVQSGPVATSGDVELFVLLHTSVAGDIRVFDASLHVGGAAYAWLAGPT